MKKLILKLLIPVSLMLLGQYVEAASTENIFFENRKKDKKRSLKGVLFSSKIKRAKLTYTLYYA